MELKLLQTVADLELRHAEAMQKNAETENIKEATAAAKTAVSQLKFVMGRVRVRENTMRRKLKLIAENVPGLQILKAGRAVSVKTVPSVWRAYQWLIGNTPAGRWQDLYGAALPADALTPGNFRQVLLHEPATPIEALVQPGAESPSLGAVVQWMAEEFLLPAAGSPLHTKLVELLAALEGTEAERVAQLEEWLAKGQAASRDELLTLKELLSVSLRK